MSKTISQLDPTGALALTNKIEVSQSDSPSSESVYGTLQQVLNVIEPNLELTPTQIDGTALTLTDTTDYLNQGTNNLYLTTDNKTTDNLVGCPNFDALVSDVSTLQTDVSNLETEVDALSAEVKSLSDDVTDLTIELDNHITDYANPHQTSLQQAYNENPLVTFDATGAINYRDSAGLQVSQFSYLGNLSHPIISHVLGDLLLNDSSMDYMFENNLAVGTCTLTIQEETGTSYANNATFFAWRTGSQVFNISAEDGVTINGINNHTISIAPNAQVKFSRFSDNTWISNVISLSPGSGTDISEGGNLSLDGSGASAGYGYIAGTGVSSSISFFDQLTYYLPPCNSPTVSRVNNFQGYTASGFRTGIKYLGTEDCTANITFVAMIRYGLSNTNTNPNKYYFSANLNLQSGPVPPVGSTGYMPIDSTGGGSDSSSEISFIISPNNLTAVSFTVQLDLVSGDVVYPLIRNDGPSTTPSDNSIYITQYAVIVQKVGDIGGATAGVTSLNGLTGNIDLIRTDSTLDIAVDGNDIDLKVNFNSVNLKSSGGELNTIQDLAPTSNPEFRSISFNTTTSPALITQITASSSTQQTCREVLCGQEFYQAGHTDTEGIAFLIGVNRTSNRQFWVADSARCLQNSTNPVLRQIIAANGSPVVIDSTATDGSTALPITFGQSGAQTTLAGSTVNVPSLTASYPVFADSSKNLASTNTARNYAFGTTNPSVDSNTDTAINVVSSNSSKSAQLNIASSGLNEFLLFWSGRTGDVNSAMMWGGSTDLRFGTATAGSVNTSGFLELFRMSANGDFYNKYGFLICETAGTTVKIKRGTNACSGDGATMIAGVVTVNTTAVQTGDHIYIMKTASSGTSGNGMPVITINSGVSFTITGGASDGSTFSWDILKAA